MGRRIRWLGLILIVCFTLVILQLVNIQVRQASSLDSAAKNPRNLAKQFDNNRGTILAADGQVLAKSLAIANAKPNTDQYRRTYPTGPLFAGIVGYSSPFYGTSGVESVYNQQLQPHKQTATTLGQLLSPPKPTPDDVTLTVQPKLQKTAQDALAAIPNANKDGAVVAIQPKTGSILAMYSSPTFDPNALANTDVTAEETAGKSYFTTKDAEGFLPGIPLATFNTFLPGSTFKVVTSSAVYNLKPGLANFTFPVAGCTTKGQIPTTTNVICNDANTPTNANPCGGTMTQMLPESCDPGYAMLGLNVGGTTLAKQADLFGYNATPPIDLTHVQKSRFPTPKNLQPGQTPGPGGIAYGAFGQGTVSATALQNAMVAAGIADTGVVMTPHVMAEIRDSQGRLVQSYKPTPYKQATSATAAKQVNQLMQGVVTTPKGTAYGVGFPAADQVAVKTGTAQVGNASQNTVDWMIGFAPASNPTVAVAVVVPEQATTASGASIAGPIMKAVIEQALALNPPPPSSTTTTTTTTPTTKATPTTVASHLVPGTTTTTTTAPAATTTTTTIPTTTTTAPVATTTTPATTTTVPATATAGSSTPPTAATP